ncbi:MAG: VanZ family protein [Ruminococcaceae bacterium]|nr:VanZ family protein [Oscillospiraceae bacterium]
MKKNWWRWVLVVAWMVVIYLFSAQTGEESGQLSGGITRWIVERITPNWHTLSVSAQREILVTWRFIVRKGAHMAEFAVLSMMFFYAWSGMRERTRGHRAVLSAACCFLVAALDEGHQAFVPARGPSLRDVFFDFAGAVLGILLLLAVLWIVRKCTKRKEMHAFS